MQNKQTLIGLFAAAIILLGAVGVFLYSKNKSSQEQPNTITSGAAQENKNSSVGETLTSLIKSGKTQECTFSYTDLSGGSTKGIAYITKDKMRTDLTITSNSKESNVYVIRNGDDNYIWGSGFPNNTGLKMTLSLDDYESNSDSKKYFDPTKKVDYKCSEWSVNASVFTPPANVKFSDFSAMIEGMMKISPSTTGSTRSGTNSSCSACNSLTGDAKTACLSQLGCSL